MKIFKVIQIQWESTARLAISLVQELKIIEMSFLIQFVVVFIFDNFNLDSALDFQLLFFLSSYPLIEIFFDCESADDFVFLSNSSVFRSSLGKRRARLMFLHISLADVAVTIFPMAGESLAHLGVETIECLHYV